MAGNAGLIKAGGAVIELMLDKTSALQGMREFEARFRQMQRALGRIGGAMNFGAGVERSFSRAMIRGLQAAFSANAYESAFNSLANGLGTAIRRVFNGQFFAAMSNGFREAGRGLVVSGLAATLVFGKLSGLITQSLTAFSRQQQLAGRFTQVFKDLEKDANSFAETLAGDVLQSVTELRDEMATFQGVLLGAGFAPQDAMELSKMLTETTQDMLAFDDKIVDSAEAMDKLLSGMAGMVKPVERFGADIRKSAIDEAFEKMAGDMEKVSTRATQQERILARLGIIFEALGRSGAIGQARREAGLLASVLRGLKGATEMAFASVGKALEPIGTKVVLAFILAANAIERFAEASPGLVQAGAALLVSLTALAGVMTATGVLFVIVGANLKALATAMSAALTPLRLFAGGMSALVNLAAGFNAVVGTTVSAIVGIAKAGGALGVAAKNVVSLGIALAGMGKAAVTVLAGTVVTSIARATSFFVVLGTTSAQALLGMIAPIKQLVVSLDLLAGAIARLAIFSVVSSWRIFQAVVTSSAQSAVRAAGTIGTGISTTVATSVRTASGGFLKFSQQMLGFTRTASTGIKRAFMPWFLLVGQLEAGMRRLGKLPASTIAQINAALSRGAGSLVAYTGKGFSLMTQTGSRSLAVLNTGASRSLAVIGAASNGVFASFQRVLSQFATIAGSLLRQVGQRLQGVFKSLGTVASAAAKGVGKVGAVLGGALLGALGTFASLLATLGGIAASTLGFIATSFASVLAPVLAIGVAIGLLTVVFVRMKPYVESVFSAIFGAGGALSSLFDTLKSVGGTAFSALMSGFQTLLADGKAAFKGLSDAIRAGDLSLAFSIAWSFIKLEFYKGYAAIAASWDEWRTYLLTVGNDLWTALQVLFSDGFIELQVLADMFVQTFGGAWEMLVGWIKPLWEGFLEWFSGMTNSTGGEWNALWDSSQSTVLQVVDLIKDAFDVTVNYLISVWDGFIGILEKAWALARSLVDSTVDYESEAARIDKANAAASAQRENEMGQRILDRENERKQKSKEIEDQKAAKEKEIRDKAVEAQKKIDGARNNAQVDSARKLQEQQQDFKDKLQQAEDAAREKGDRTMGQAVMEGFRGKMDEIQGRLGMGEEAKAVSRANSAAFADVAAFGLGVPDVQKDQLKELRQLRRIAERQERKPAAKAGGVGK